MKELENITTELIDNVRNQLYIKYNPLAPAIFRMPVKFMDDEAEVTCGFGTDGENMWVKPQNVIKNFDDDIFNVMQRQYLHSLFHCIYLHPFMQGAIVSSNPAAKIIYDLSLDICCEAAIMQLNPESLQNDNERAHIINEFSSKVKLFLPNLVFKEIVNSIDTLDIQHLYELFHFDDHLWLEPVNLQKKRVPSNSGDGNSSDSENSDDDNSSESATDRTNRGDSENDSDGNNKNKNEKNKNPSKSQQNKQKSQSAKQKLKQDWSSVAKRITTDMQSFHKNQGYDAGGMMQTIDHLTADKMDYEEFLRNFAIIEEKMMVNMDEFDYSYYMYGMSLQQPEANNKKILLIEPLEYKEEKVVKDFVIAIDTSGSCQGDLVKKFLNKTFSILKDTESFSQRVNIHIIQCDTRVQHDTKIENLQDLETFMKDMKLYGFGGTDFRPVFEYVEELNRKHEFENLSGLIYFTDGYGTYPQNPTTYKTAFAFLEDYNNRTDVPSWAMSVYWNDDELVV